MSIRKSSSTRARSPQTNGDALRRAVNWILDPGIFGDLKVHGNVKWTGVALVTLAVFWVWTDEPSLVEAAKVAVKTVTAIFGDAAVRTYQALTGALITYSDQLLPLLWLRMQVLMERVGGDRWRIGRWLPLAVDGSRVGTPRTRKNEARFCKPAGKKGKKKGKKKRGRHAHRKPGSGPKKSHYDPQAVGPQMWLTLVWHVGMRMPWCWKVGPSYSSERNHLLEMIATRKFPDFTLFCADAGFVGYAFWNGIVAGGHHFLVRVGSNVRLLKKLGYVRERDGIVYCWPDAAMKKKQLPLVLRLLHFHDGRGDVYLVTNVLSETDLTDQQAGEIYRRRWGVELQFRAFKQTFGRSKLRSRTPDPVEVELHWSLVGLWMLQLLAFREQTAAGEPPEHTSVAAILRIVRAMMRTESCVPVRGQSFSKQLAAAQTDDYERHSKKKSRNYPRRKEEPSAGKPIIKTATKEHRGKLHQLEATIQVT